MISQDEPYFFTVRYVRTKLQLWTGKVERLLEVVDDRRTPLELRRDWRTQQLVSVVRDMQTPYKIEDDGKRHWIVICIEMKT